MRYVHLYMEANPNPASMKFVANFFLVPEGLDFHYENAEEAEDSPLAKYLFAMEFVDKVFIMSNFVTVTKKNKCHLLKYLSYKYPKYGVQYL